MKRPRGQGLLEMIVAIGVIVTGVVGALALVSASLSASGESQGRMVATGLAREGIEAVRAIRDSNWLAARKWDAGLAGILADRSGVPALDLATGAWAIDFGPNVITDSGTEVMQGGALSSNVYHHGAGVSTPFRRLITMQLICWDDASLKERFIAPPETACLGSELEAGAEVESVVRWTYGTRQHDVRVIERIYDWR